MMAIDPTLANGVVVGRLARTADPAGTQDETGNGRINLARALLDTGTDFIQPAGSAPVGEGGPFVGPYRAAAISTTTTLASTPNPSTSGQSVTFTATVTCSTACTFPAGSSIAFVENANNGCNGGTTLASTTALTGSGLVRQATFATASLPAGSHSIRACFNSTSTSGSNAQSSVGSPVNQVVNAAALTTLAVSPASGTFGGTVTLQATLTSGGSAVNGKSIAFTLNGASVGSAATNVSGVASLSSVSLTGVNAGTYVSGVGASFAGDSGFQASSGTGTLTVAQAPSTTTLTCPASVTYTGLAQTPCTASVTGAGGLNLAPTPTYTNNMNAGTATASYTFAGDANHTGSTGSKNFAIDKANTTTSVASSLNPSTADDSVTFTATVAGVGTVSGSVQFVVDGVDFDAPVPLGSGGQASLTTSALTAAKTYAINAVYSGDGNLHSSNGILAGGQVVTAGAPAQLALGVQPTDTQAGQAIAPAVTVRVLDSAGNLTSDTSDVTVAISAGGVLDGGSTTTVAASAGIATFGNLKPTKAGTFTLHATDGTMTAADSSNFDVLPGPAVTFAIDLPGSTTAGQSFSFTLTAKDQFDNAATGYTGIVHFTSTDAQSLLPSDTALVATDQGVKTFTLATVLKTAGNQTITATDTVAVTPIISGTSATITVSPGNATVLLVTAPAAAVAGAPFDVMVEARDGFGNTATGYVGPIHFDITDPKADPLPDYAFMPATDNGIHVFSATLRKAGQWTVKATDTGVLLVTGTSGTIAVQPGPPAKLLFKTQPASTYVGVPIPDFDVAVEDADDNVVDSSSAAITIATGNNPTGVAVLSGATTVNAVNGITTFSGLGLNKAATGYTLVASSGTLEEATSEPFEVGKGTATLSLGNLSHKYDGSPKSATVTTTPTGLSGVSVTYDGSSSPPAGAGSYAVVASLDNPDYQAANATGTLVIEKASSTTVVTCPASVTYNGAAQEPCTAKVTGAGDLDQTLTVSYSNNMNAGTATASASFAGDNNHTESSDSKTFTINKADPIVTVTGNTCTYNGNPCAATGSAKGVNGEDLTPVTIAYTVVAAPPRSAGDLLQTAPVDAGSYQAAARFAGNANYNGKQSTPATVTINKASSTTTVTCPASVTYNGAPQEPCTAKVTGAGNLDQTLTVSYSNNMNAGTATASASFAGDNNHTGSNEAKTFTINKADSIVTVTGNTCTYNTNPCAATGSAKGVNGEDLTPVTVAYTVVAAPPRSAGDLLASAPVDAGSYQAAARFAGNANYNGKQSSPATITINKASSTTTVSCPASVTYNGVAQTPCTASVSGVGGLNQSLTVGYTNNLNAGTATASATFAGDANHTGSSDTKTFTINKASTSTALASTPNPSNVGQTVTFTATVSPGAAPGIVTFKEGANILGTGVVAAGVATFSTSTLAAGPHAVTAEYGGSANYFGSASNVTTQKVNGPPTNVAVSLSAASINENDTVTLAGAFSDPYDYTSGSHTITIDWGDGSATTILTVAGGAGVFNVPSGVTHQYLDDNPTATATDSYTISVTVTDSGGLSGVGITSITVNNAPAVITGVMGPIEPIALGGAATLTATFTDVGSQDTHSCTFQWNDGTPATTVNAAGTGNGTCSATHSYVVSNVYQVDVTVTDDDTGIATSSFQYAVVFDAKNGFVTGGGWINSPAGAYAANPALTGKANFGFVSKYQKGADVPTGNTEFQFQAAGFNFKSTEYEWLVIAGPKAQYKGSGTINGAGEYGFLLTAIDGSVNGGGGIDKFRLKAWDKSTGNVIYDNQTGASETADPATALGGGSIVIHK
jgi:hypothetical protein